MLRSLEEVQTPKFTNIKKEVFEVLGNINTLKKSPKEDQLDLLNTIEKQLINLCNTIDKEDSKQQTIKAMAFELANRI